MRSIPLPQFEHSRRSRHALEQLHAVKRESVAVPELDRLDAMRQDGEAIEAMQRLRRIAEAIGQQSNFDERHRYLWIRAHRQMLDCLADLQRTSDLRPLLTQFSRKIETPGWQRWKKDVGPQFERLIRLNVHLNRFAEALDVYEECRNFVDIDDVTFRSLALAAARLLRSDDGAIDLFLRYMREPRRDQDVHWPTILEALRAAIRIDMHRPESERIEKLIRANERLHASQPLLWPQAHCAVGFARLGRREESLAAAARCAPLDEANADTLLLLGLALALAEQWPAARDRFQRAADHGADDAVTTFFLSLARLHEALHQPELFADRQALIAAIAHDLPHIAAAPAPELSIDEAWVRLHAAVVLDDVSLIDKALRELPSARLPRWRHVVVWAAAAWDRGRDDLVRAWASQGVSEGDRLAMLLASGASAIADLLGGHAEAALPAAARAAQLAGDAALAQHDPDLAPGASVLPAMAAALTVGAPADAAGAPFSASSDASTSNNDNDAVSEARASVEESLDSPATRREDGALSAVVRAEHARLAAQKAVALGQFDDAARWLNDRSHDANSPWLHQHLAAIVAAHQGRSLEATALFNAVVAREPSHPARRLANGLWNLALEQFDPAIAELETIPADDPCRLDALLGLLWAHSALDHREGCDVMLVEAMGLLSRSGVARPAAMRPWRMQIDPADWCHGVAGVADGCHLAACATRIGRPSDALPILRGLIEQLPAGAPSAGGRIGRVADEAVFALIDQGRFDEACEGRELALPLVGERPEFVQKLAAAMRRAGATALSDVLTAHLVEHAGQSEHAFDGSDVALLLATALLIDGREPVGGAELSRRARWTRELAQRRPQWSWPHRNLARAALRAQDHDACVAHLAAIGPDGWQPADHLLRAWACLAGDRLSEAASSFAAAAEAGCNEAVSLPMAAGCRVLHGWRHGDADTSAPMVDSLLRDLQLGETADGSDEAERVAEWTQPLRASLLIQAGRFDDAVKVIAAHVQDRLPACAQVLQGLAELRQGDAAAGALRWSRVAVDAAASGDVHVLLLWHVLASPGYAHLAAAEEVLLEMHRAGRQDRMFHLLSARFNHRCGRTAEAASGRALAEETSPRWQHPAMHVLDAQATAEGVMLDGMMRLTAGDVAGARTTLAQAGDLWFSRDRKRFHEALAAAHEGDMKAAAAGVKPLVDAMDVDALALSAWLAARAGDATGTTDALDRAQALEPDHPFALLIRARLAPAAQAGALWLRLAQASALVPAELRIAAHAALGRLAEGSGDLDAALKHYRDAMAADPTAPLPASRLARLVARTGRGAADGGTLAAAERVPSDRRDLALLVAMGKLAAAVKDDEQLAQVLDQLVAHDDLKASPPAARKAAARWSAHVQLRQGKITEAARAVRAMLDEEDTPELRSMLVDCRLFQMQELMRGNDKPARFEQLAAAAQDVLELAPDHQLALVLAATALLISGQTGPRHAELVSRFKTDWPTQELDLLARVNRLFTDNAEGESIDELLKKIDLPESARTYLSVLAANQRRDNKRLLPMADQVAAGMILAEDLPVAPVDLICFAARNHLARRRHEPAEALLRKIHDSGGGTPDSRRLHAVALIRSGIAQLKQQRLIPARRNLQKALGFMESVSAQRTVS